MEFQVQHWPVGEDGEETDAVEVTLMIDPLLDTVRLGATFGAFGTTLQGFGDPAVTAETKIATLEREVPKMKGALRDCLTPPSRLKFDQVSEALDVTMLGEVVRWMTQELSGLDPTRPTSSSPGLPSTGDTSTAGVPPEG